MKNSKTILPFLLLNVLVSALTVFLVIFFWDRSHPTPQVPGGGGAEVQSSSPVQPAQSNSPTYQLPVGEIKVTIEGVFGVEDLQLEYILVRNQSDQALNLLGWQVVDPTDVWSYRLYAILRP